ncbi:MAG TPA: BlaI/MecI/CopY family transcriptional regulator [Acidobacteriota bacterium]|nr:BlaI/MecI/CopY family transcriptional regulator [Acidobacteriota bacterium]
MKREVNSIILTRQELQIMKVIWEIGAATVKDVCTVMSQTKAVAYTTILTLMGILEDKGALAHTRSGRAFLFRPVLSRRQATRNQVRDVITRFFDGSPERMVEDILVNEALDPDQIETVRSLLDSGQEKIVA